MAGRRPAGARMEAERQALCTQPAALLPGALGLGTSPSPPPGLSLPFDKHRNLQEPFGSVCGFGISFPSNPTSQENKTKQETELEGGTKASGKW